uniref:Nodulin-like domain-containing protein n=1 Tax=Zea mays TaxID=4577 RepID=A0A804M1A5_MAIZE
MLRGGGEPDPGARQGLLRRAVLASGCGGQRDAQPTGRAGLQPTPGGRARCRKDLGDCVGFLAGSLSAVLPSWAMLLIGSAQNFLGYCWLWLIVTRQAPALPLWMMCVLIYVWTNGETFFNTTALVTCIQNFPKSRGQTVTRNMTIAYQNDQVLDKGMVVMGAPQGQQNGFKEAANSVEFLGSLLCVISYQD